LSKLQNEFELHDAVQRGGSQLVCGERGLSVVLGPFVQHRYRHRDQITAQCERVVTATHRQFGPERGVLGDERVQRRVNASAKGLVEEVAGDDRLNLPRECDQPPQRLRREPELWLDAPLVKDGQP